VGFFRGEGYGVQQQFQECAGFRSLEEGPGHKDREEEKEMGRKAKDPSRGARFCQGTSSVERQRKAERSEKARERRKENQELSPVRPPTPKTGESEVDLIKRWNAYLKTQGLQAMETKTKFTRIHNRSISH